MTVFFGTPCSCLSVRRLGVDGMKWPARPRQDLPGGAVQPGDDIERERER